MGPYHRNVNLQGLPEQPISMRRHRHGCLDLNPALLCSQCLCLLAARADDAPVQKQQALFPSNFGLLALFGHEGCTDGWDHTGP